MVQGDLVIQGKNKKTLTLKKFYCIGVCFLLICQAQANQIDSLFTANIAKEQLTDSTVQQKFDYLFFAGLNFVNHNSLDSAYLCFNTCCQLNPKASEAYFQISKIYQFRNLPDSAITYLNHAIELDKKNTYYQEISAAYCIAKRNYHGAVNIFEKLLKKDIDNETYIYRLIELYRILNMPKKELAMLDKIEQYKGISEEISLSKIDILINLRQDKKVVDEFNRLIRKYPFEKRYPVLLGDFYLLINKTQEGLMCYHKALEKDSTNGYAKISLYQYYDKIGDEQQAEYYLSHGLLDGGIDLSLKLDFLKKHIATLISEGKDEEAELFFKELFKIHPNEIEIYKFYVSFLIHEKCYPEAIDNLKTMLILEPDDKSIWDNLITIERDFQPDSVLATTQAATMAFPRDLNFLFSIIYIHITNNNTAEALKVCDKAIEIATEDKETDKKGRFLMTKGDIFAKKDSLQQSFAYYEQALTYLPNDALLLNNYAYLLATCNTHLKKAEQMSSKAVKAEPQNATFLDTYAWVFFMRGEYQSAKFYMERALSYDKDPIMLEHYGDILFKLGDTDNALLQWQKSVEAGNTSDILQQKIETCNYIPDIITL